MIKKYRTRNIVIRVKGRDRSVEGPLLASAGRLCKRRSTHYKARARLRNHDARAAKPTIHTGVRGIRNGQTRSYNVKRKRINGCAQTRMCVRACVRARAQVNSAVLAAVHQRRICVRKRKPGYKLTCYRRCNCKGNNSAAGNGGAREHTRNSSTGTLRTRVRRFVRLAHAIPRQVEFSPYLRGRLSRTPPLFPLPAKSKIL